MANQRATITTRLILEYEGQTLFLVQTTSNGGGFTLPGGRVDNLEFAKEALVRETREETGVKVKKSSLELVHVVHHRMKSTVDIVIFFRTLQWQGKMKIKEPDKFKTTVWIPNNTLPERLPAILRFSLERIQMGKLYSEYPKAL